MTSLGLTFPINITEPNTNPGLLAPAIYRLAEQTLENRNMQLIAPNRAEHNPDVADWLFLTVRRKGDSYQFHPIHKASSALAHSDLLKKNAHLKHIYICTFCFGLSCVSDSQAQL